MGNVIGERSVRWDKITDDMSDGEVVVGTKSDTRLVEGANPKTTNEEDLILPDPKVDSWYLKVQSGWSVMECLWGSTVARGTIG